MSALSDNVTIDEWKLRLDKIDDKRLRLLKQKMPFSVIAERISNHIIDIKFSPEKGDREARGKKRARFCFRIPDDTLDIFFNSSHGYRAQYYIDPQRGTEGNRLVINMVKDKLIEAARQTDQSVVTIDQIKKSLEYESAKVWIDEKESTLNQTSRDPQEIQVLEVPRWVSAMNQVLAAWNAGQLPDPTNKTRALLGVQAPEGSCLKILGAWLDDKDQEFVVLSKVGRAKQIHEYGFS